MPHLTLLRDLVLLVAVAVPVVAVMQRLRVPSVVGYLASGVLLGPHALGLIHHIESVQTLAELGVALLLFTIGLELSLSRVLRMGREVLQGGTLQVAGTIAVVAPLAMLLGLEAPRAVAFGVLAALSSTALVLRLLEDRNELDTIHGRILVAVLLFQDLCVVPLMLLLPVLAQVQVDPGAGLWRMVRGSLVVALLVLAGRFIVPRVLARIVALRNPELFTLCIFLFGLGSAYLAARSGLSLALGAFIAGLVVSESDYGLQALSDFVPFRDTFTGIFFISVGMLLDPGFLWQRASLVAGATLALVALKALVAAAATASLGRPLHVAVHAGLALANVGEFSFVLASLGLSLGLIQPEGYQLFIAASVLSMLLAPLALARGREVGEGVARLVGQPSLRPEPGQEVRELHDHVIVVGYGINGRNLARALKAAGIPYAILEQNAYLVREARRAAEPIYYGDGTRRQILEEVGAERARVLVLAISSPVDERRGVAVARTLNPGLRIIVRTREVAEIEELRRLGADEVIPEEFETSVEIFARVLRVYGVPSNVIEREVQAARADHYEMLRGLSVADLRLDPLLDLGLHRVLDTVLVEAGAEAVGESPWSLQLRRRTGATVVAVVRDGRALHNPDPKFEFRAGDVVVLVGDREALDRALRWFRAGAPE